MSVDIKIPQLKSELIEAKLVNWLVNVGDDVSENEILCTVESGGLQESVQSGVAGVITKLWFEPGDIVRVGQKIALIQEHVISDSDLYVPIDQKVETTVITPKSTGKIATQSQLQDLLGINDLNIEGFAFKKAVKEDAEPTIVKAKIAPLAKKLAKENNVDLSKVKGTGPDGKIIEHDVTNYLINRVKEEAHSVVENSVAAVKQLSEKWILKTEIEADKLIEFYNAVSDEVSFTTSIDDIVICAVMMRLLINKYFSKFCIDNSVAVKILKQYGHNVYYPVIKSRVTLSDVASKIKQINEKIQSGQFKEENESSFGVYISQSDYLTEFIHPLKANQVACLSVSQIIEKPIVKNGVVKPTRVITLVLSADSEKFSYLELDEFFSEVKNILRTPDLIDVE